MDSNKYEHTGWLMKRGTRFKVIFYHSDYLYGYVWFGFE